MMGMEIKGKSGLTWRSHWATVWAMVELRKTTDFARWLDGLCDLRARARVQARIARLANGHFGDCKLIGMGVSELRIDYGPGYRVYFIRQGASLVILLAGGDKRRQAGDIKKAVRLAQDLEDLSDG